MCIDDDGLFSINFVPGRFLELIHWLNVCVCGLSCPYQSTTRFKSDQRICPGNCDTLSGRKGNSDKTQLTAENRLTSSIFWSFNKICIARAAGYKSFEN
jgi:hypothetical protein